MGFKGPARWGGDSGGKRSVQAHGNKTESNNPADTTGLDATDAAKALAAEHNVDLRDVTATGATGITKGDVETYLEAHAEPEPELEEPLEPIPDEADDLHAAETA